ncbi:hypothetical protein [Glycomyces buryatensis]|uniref:Uncharacterized protein n=1 Tax=Glycomyces buryatensis TaxID=2570927 RepID=A0A4S8QA24_9ACTN|nr:hypothetical protein [Glycomyces buryatensis]THV41110.1 hypothetical protein FAB82_13170 [Glycomyces buryatensis]
MAATIVMAFVIPRLTYFKYSIGYSGHIEASNPWRGGWRYYPRPGYSHLEYSIASREIHEIRRRDGKRHRVPVWASRANPTDWQEFVETFFPAAGLPIALLAPESEGSPESADVGRESD